MVCWVAVDWALARAQPGGGEDPAVHTSPMELEFLGGGGWGETSLVAD